MSRVAGRDGETFVSPDEQRERIRARCERDGIVLADVLEELDVSGGTALAKRPGLRRAVEMVETGEVDTVVVAYFDRLVRSLIVQAEVVERVEQAGGRILALDVGEVSADTASRWLSSTMLGAVAEYHRRVTSERTAEAKVRAVARGVPPFPNVPPGYRQRPDGTLEPNQHAATVADAFTMRANGATIARVRDHLAANGIRRSYHGTQALLESRIPLGELRFGEIVNVSAHEPIVDPVTWARAQRQKLPRGPKPSSDRLLARTGVLRCGTCGSPMQTGTTRQQGTTYSFYRCSAKGSTDCSQRVTISATVAEEVVEQAVVELLAGISESAHADDGIQAAERELDAAERELDAAVRAFSALDDVTAVRERLLELRRIRDAAVDRVNELRSRQAPAVTVSADDWPLLTVDERRAIIRATLERVDVHPAGSGSPADRLTIQPRQ